MFPSVHYRNRLIVINNRLNRLIVLTRPQWSMSLPRRGHVLRFYLMANESVIVVAEKQKNKSCLSFDHIVIFSVEKESYPLSRYAVQSYFVASIITVYFVDC